MSLLMMPAIIVARSSVGGVVEPDGGAYKIQSDNHSLVETPAQTHHSGIPARHHGATSLTSSKRRSIRHGCKQSQKSRRYVVWK